MEDYRIVAARAGGPEVLTRQAITAEAPSPGQVRVRQTVVGVNFIDTYHRSGLYPGPMPSPLGSEAAGVVEAVHPDVEGFSPGDRVAYGTGELGAYCTVRAVSATHLTHIPEGISDETAAAVMLKGMTAAYLVGPCAKVQAGQVVLVHAAAGGVGSLLTPWLKALGARVLAHAGTAEKAARAKAGGAEWALSCPMEDLAKQVRDLTDGHGADVVLDGVGKASWSASLGAVATCGLLVSYGNASGPVPAVAPLELMRAGSVFLTRPTLKDYGATPAQRRALTDALFARIESGDVPVHIGRRNRLSDAAAAHRALEARETTGAIVLTVDRD